MFRKSEFSILLLLLLGGKGVNMVELNLDILSITFSCSFIQRFVSTLVLYFKISEIFRSWYNREFGWMGVARQCALSITFLTQFTKMVRKEFFFSF